MPLLNVRRRVQDHVANKAARAIPNRYQNSAVAGTVLAPVLSNHAPWLVPPYLGMRSRLSQVWINRWTILLLLCLVRTLIAIVSMHDGINSARKEALSACTGVEAAGSAMASMPHYMSQGVNELTASGVEKAIDGLMSMLTLTVTGVEEIVVFYINMLTSTYVCLITLVVSGSLHAAIALIEDVTGFLNKTLGGIGNDIQSTVDVFEKGLDGVIGGLNDVGNLFGGHNNIPKLDLDSQISALHNLKLPSDLTSDLDKLNASIPTFAQVNNFTNSAIRFPFVEIKKLISSHVGHDTFDRSVFPVPAKEKLTFCNDNDGINPFFDGLIDIIYDARKIATAVLVTLALLVMVPMAWREMRRYRIMKERAAMMNSGHEPMDVVYLASRPMSSGVGLKLASNFEATRRQAAIRWAIAYATTVPALFVLSLAIAGLFSCLCRYIILEAVTKEVPHLVHEIDGFADKVLLSLNNASMQWAEGTNAVILNKNNEINHDIFGWVNISTHALNDTLNTFVDQTINVLNETFGGTILYDPVTELFNCLIGLKIAGIEKGLTWISDNAHVEFPLLPNNTFSLGALASMSNDNSTNNSTASADGSSDFLSDPTGGSSDAVSGAVKDLIEHIANSIRTEALISTGVLCIWLIVVLVGIIRAFSIFYGKDTDRNVSPTSTPSFTTADHFRPENARPTFPAVGVMSEKQAMATQEVPVRNPFADPSDGFVHSPPYKPPTPPEMVHPTSPSYQNGANSYRGMPYTIAPRAFPRFNTVPEGDRVGEVVPGSPTGVEVRQGIVRTGDVGLAVRRPTTQRQSSYVEMGRAAAGTPGRGVGGESVKTTFGELGH